MKQQTSPAIVLRRTNYGEADRIVTFLTPVGKISAMVKGVRRSKSKLAGGIELFSETIVTFMETRGDLARIISTRLEVHYENIVGDLKRMMFGYEAMKLIDKIIEQEAELSYYQLLKKTFEALNMPEIELPIIELWFYLRLANQEGNVPNLKNDSHGNKLSVDSLYSFSNEEMCFLPNNSGLFRSDHVKLMRLSLTHSAKALSQIKGGTRLAEDILPIVRTIKQG